MRIAMFTNNYKPYVGGVPVSIEHLAQALRRRGHVVYVFAPTYRGQQEEEYVIRYPSFPISVAGAPAPNILTGIFEKKVRELGIELIHVHHPALVGNVALFLKRKYGIPVVFTYHTRYEQYLHYIRPLEYVEHCTRFVEKYLTYFSRHCDMLIAPTPGMKEYLLERNPDACVGVMPTGLPEICYQPDMLRVRELKRTYQKEADYLFCTVSRLAKEKNLIFLLEGLARVKKSLKQQGKTFRHLMIGDGPQKKELEEKAIQLGLGENLVFTGNVPNEEIRNYQAASDLFLFSSKSETQGIVILEAMAVGNPVVALNATGVRDVVKNKNNGFLCEEQSDLWAENVVAALKDPGQYRKLRQAAEATARMYSEASVAETAEGYYRQICCGISRWGRVCGTM